MDLYAETILDHYRNPHHYGRLKKHTMSGRDSNPLCGDNLQIDLLVDAQNNIADVGFTAQGCAISKASASMLCDELIGKSLQQALLLKNEDIFKMIGVPLTPVRAKCALLCLFTLKKAVVRKIAQPRNSI